MNKKSELDCYLFYMLNRWSKEECLLIFGTCLGEHLWEKWDQYYERYSAYAAAAPFYIDLDGGNRKKIVERAMAFYN